MQSNSEMKYENAPSLLRPETRSPIRQLHTQDLGPVERGLLSGKRRHGLWDTHTAQG